jgi:dipeptidase D
MTQIRSLEPKILWKYFDDILKIPRPSKKEEKIREFLIKFAIENKLQHKTDKAGNLLISKDGTTGYENRKTVVLQSHLDMVCEKNNDVVHDFEKDEITALIEGEWVTANGTTLGADDGIGIASQMAILASDSIEHGPLECLFTVDEETGLTGAMALDSNFFEGKILLNLDSEDEGELFIGCAGGIDTIAEFKYKTRIFPSAHIAAKISVEGLKGGHSGDEIHKSPGGNSNKILNRFLWNAGKKFAVRLSEFNGGNLRNAIPREAFAIIAVPSDNWMKLRDYFSNFSAIIKEELSATEPDVKLKLEKHEAPEIVLSRKSQSKLLSSLYACPHGVIKWSDEVEDMVETSTNLASVKFKEPNRIIVTTSQRSSIESAKQDIADRVFAIFESLGAKVRHTDGYPGWSPDQNSEILKITESGYTTLFNEKPVVRAIHAGLECGLFLDKYPDLDMISFGPTIKRAHSPDEKINIPSTDKYWKLLLEVLKNIPEKKQ